MSSMMRKIKRNKVIDIKMSMRFKCVSCNFEKLISKETFDNLDKNTINENEIFFCKNCNKKMMPVSVEVDY